MSFRPTKFRPLRFRCLLHIGAAILAVSVALPAPAQQAPVAAAHQDVCGPRTALPPAPAPIPQGDLAHHLPANSATHQRLDLPGRTLCFTATAGTIHLPTDPATANSAAAAAYA